jgi:HK97 family phage major capsid protein
MFTKFYNSRGVVLRKFKGRAVALFQFGAPVGEGASFSLADVFPPAGVMLRGLALFALAILAILATTFLAGDVAGVALAFPAVASTRDLKTILAELRALQDKFKGKPMPEAEAKQFDDLAREAKELQDSTDRDDLITGLAKATDDAERKARKVNGQPLIPGDGQPGDDEVKSEPIAGYMSLGDYVIAQKALADFLASSRPKGAQFALATLSGLAHARAVFGKRKFSGEPMIPITVAEYKSMRANAKGTKAVPTLGADVIEPTRLADMVRVDEHEQLRLRDVLNIGRTGSNAVQYMRLASYTRAAATVAHGSQKPEATLTMDTVTEAVRTIAAWIPVNDQQLDDMPALSGIINTELLYDLDRHVEELVTYGDGIGQNFLGIVPNPDVLAARSEGGDTLIDTIRRGITDVRRDGYMPNGILIDPLDWETILLQKGSDNHYIWVVVTEENVSRLWGVPVIESTAATDIVTGARNVIIGDWMRGATLWDRMDSTVSVGWQNDQFIRNQRTILAELRAAFGVRRPRAFRTHETAAAGS